jgi:hypothetical protein
LIYFGITASRLGGGRGTDEQRDFCGNVMAFGPEGDSHSFSCKKNRQRMGRHRWRVGVHRNADRTGTGTARRLGVRVCVGRFQPGEQRNQNYAAQRHPSLPAWVLELAMANHRPLVSATSIRTIAPAASNGNTTYLMDHEYFGPIWLLVRWAHAACFAAPKRVLGVEPF